MGYRADADEQQRFTQFVTELAELSKKTGIVLSACACVYFVEPDEPALKELYYRNDPTSGDLDPENFFDEGEPL